MVKLGSNSCCRPLLQGMMPLALLLLASIQAGPVMAVWEQVVGAMEEGKQIFMDHGGKQIMDHVGEKAPYVVADKALNEVGKKPGWGDFRDGGKKGLKVYKKWCKAQRWMDQQNPGGASSIGLVPCWSTTTMDPITPNDAVRITSIRAGQAVVPVQTPAPAYLSTARLLYTTKVEIENSLREAVRQQMTVLGATPTLPSVLNNADKLCFYKVAAASLPDIAIQLASRGNVMPTMELVGGATDAFWYQEPSSMYYCLGVRRTVELLI